MRKLMAVALATGILAGCHAQPIGTMAPQAATAPAVRAQSDSGLKKALRHTVNNQFKQADWNQDGVLAPNESHGLDSKAFALADTNKDYKLTVSEYLKYAKSQEPQLLQMMRQAAQVSFQYSDTNKDNFVSVDEFYTSLNPTPMPVPPGPYPDPSSVPTGNSGSYSTKATTATPGTGGGYYEPGGTYNYGSGYYTPGNGGYGSGYGGYDPYPAPYYPSYPTVTRQHAATMFNLSDRNRDRKLNPSEWEDLSAWMMASGSEPSDPYPIPTGYPSGYPSFIPPTPTPAPTAIPSTPAVQAQSLRR